MDGPLPGGLTVSVVGCGDNAAPIFRRSWALCLPRSYRAAVARLIMTCRVCSAAVARRSTNQMALGPGVRIHRPRMLVDVIGLVSVRRGDLLRLGPFPDADALLRHGDSPGLVQPHSRDLSTSNSAPGEDGSKPCSISQRAARRHRNDHHPRITSRSTSVP
jgi:hypothetical protein